MPRAWIDNAKFAAAMVVAYLLVTGVVTLAGMSWTAAKPRVLGPTVHVDVSIAADPGTGCQYLVTSTGGITPRMAPDGTHICTAQAEVEG